MLQELYKSLDTNQPLSKRHKINDFLGFGFRKDDVVLDPLIDRWESSSRQTHARFCWWVDEKFRPYANHALAVGERIRNNGLFQELYESTQKILAEVERPQPHGAAYVTVLQIKAAVVIFAAAVLFRLDTIESLKSGCMSYWYALAAELSRVLAQDQDAAGSEPLINATRDLRLLIEGARTQ